LTTLHANTNKLHGAVFLCYAIVLSVPKYNIIWVCPLGNSRILTVVHVASSVLVVIILASPTGPLRSFLLYGQDTQLLQIFTARRYSSAVYDVTPCLSATSWVSRNMAKHGITQSTFYDSTGTLVFWRQRSRRNSNAVTPKGSNKYGWGRSKSATFDQ